MYAVVFYIKQVAQKSHKLLFADINSIAGGHGKYSTAINSSVRAACQTKELHSPVIVC